MTDQQAAAVSELGDAIGATAAALGRCHAEGLQPSAALEAVGISLPFGVGPMVDSALMGLIAAQEAGT